ncbi:dihydrofolate reductase [Novosphingobium kunmingense]|uniref:Dihydrofolate reductase n=1 Tax=Novosphingobium kunmingense TaxID=1211806 RepID=A0A2N0I3P4_9SPHN|nr:dihydrofolate reductase family protein [Novosphingobium kunmingense]PKB25809.1 dihydrofolate reductase [Novosphingobium kunmingense]
MRRIIGAAFVTLDGVIQGPGGPTEDTTGGFDQGGWVFKLDDEGINPVLESLFGGDYALLLGRRTYDIFAAYWPYVTGAEAGLGEAFTRADKFVMTRGDQPLGWKNSHRLSSMADLAAVKAGNGPDLVIQGSSTLYPALLAAGLLDRLTLMTYALTVGPGKRLFGQGTPPGMLRLVEHTITPKGTVITTFEPVGALPPMPADAPEPSTSALEAERQARMKAGTW